MAITSVCIASNADALKKTNHVESKVTCFVFFTLNIFVWSVSDGQFGAYMQVGIQNDGPVTITIDTASSVCIHVLVAILTKL